MGLFDEFTPDPSIACPKCDEGVLDRWQGKHSRHGLLVWRQGIAHPVGELADDEELRWPAEELQRKRLPENEGLWAAAGTCSSCGFQAPFAIDIELRDGTWTEVGADGPPLAGTHLDDGWVQCPGCKDAFCLGNRGLYFCKSCKQLVR